MVYHQFPRRNDHQLVDQADGGAAEDDVQHVPLQTPQADERDRSERRSDQVDPPGPGEQHMFAEEDGEVQHDADHRGGDRRQRGAQADVAACLLDVRRAQEDPQETGQEGEIRRDQRAEETGDGG
jgi:hypothetical protein